ncbi:MAG: hypothetical protein JSR85_09035, partial [Proteobacteria bacterium]|nr:hypothetical protein [Pseudomonadota bacterium]
MMYRYYHGQFKAIDLQSPQPNKEKKIIKHLTLSSKKNIESEAIDLTSFEKEDLKSETIIDLTPSKKKDVESEVVDLTPSEKEDLKSEAIDLTSPGKEDLKSEAIIDLTPSKKEDVKSEVIDLTLSSREGVTSASPKKESSNQDQDQVDDLNAVPQVKNWN